MHKANSACCYFVCTFDSSRNKLYEFIGENCVIELLNTLKILPGNCISELKKALNYKYQTKESDGFKCEENVIYVMVNLLN
jgi:hypothetical protein